VDTAVKPYPMVGWAISAVQSDNMVLVGGDSGQVLPYGSGRRYSGQTILYGSGSW